MNVSSFTWWEILGCLRGVAAFVPVLVAPGFCIAWATNLFHFRRRPFSEQTVWSIVASLGVMGIFAAEAAKYALLSAVCWFCVASLLAMFAIVASGLRRPIGQHLRIGESHALIALWVAFVLAELIDLGIDHRLLLNVAVFDHSLRTAFVNAVMRTGVPPSNPLFWPSHPVPMRYYYFWYVLTAVAAFLGHVTARQALIASIVWSGFGLAAILKLYCSEFLPSIEGPDRTPLLRWRPYSVALFLLLVTGVDVLPAAAKGILHLPMDPDMEWWSPDQVASWLDSVLWVPHHLAGLVCCLFGFLLVWMSNGRSRREQAICAVLAGLSFASAVGFSVYVPLAFALVMSAWVIWAFLWERQSKSRIPVLAAAGLIASGVLIPFLRELTARTDEDATSGLLCGYIRHMIDPTLLLGVPAVARFAAMHPTVENAIAGLILLVPGYLLELGFYALVLALVLRAARRSQLQEADRTALFLTLAGLVVASFLRSTTIVNNDFGYRSVLVSQSFLLLLAVRWCEGAFGNPGHRLGLFAWVLLCIGIAGSAYQAAELRLYLPVQARLGRPNAAGIPARAWAWRNAYEAMHRTVPADAVVQYNMAQPSYDFVSAQLLGVDRQTASGLPGCGAPFGGPAGECSRVEAEIARLFSGNSVSAEQARAACKRLGVDYLIPSRWDPVWADRSAWVWTLPPAVAADSVRVASCRQNPTPVPFR